MPTRFASTGADFTTASIPARMSARSPPPKSLTLPWTNDSPNPKLPRGLGRARKYLCERSTGRAPVAPARGPRAGGAAVRDDDHRIPLLRVESQGREQPALHAVAGALPVQRRRFPPEGLDPGVDRRARLPCADRARAHLGGIAERAERAGRRGSRARDREVAARFETAPQTREADG